jgi:hypothetical protein
MIHTQPAVASKCILSLLLRAHLAHAMTHINLAHNTLWRDITTRVARAAERGLEHVLHSLVVVSIIVLEFVVAVWPFAQTRHQN